VRREAVAWERAAEVRAAAAAWRKAGVIDRATHEAIDAAHPDPCVTPTAVWRILTAGMVSAVVLCLLGAVAIAAQPGVTGLALLLVLFAGAAVAATERLEASPRLARRGAAGATAFWGGVFFLAALALRSSHAVDHVLVAGVVVWGAGCWRWGSPLFAGLAAMSLFAFLGRLPLGRLLWVLAGSALAALAARRTDAPGWAPSHRRAASVLLVLGVAAVYVALNVYSLDEQLLEALRPLAPPRAAPPAALLVTAAVATAVLPLAVLAWAWASRRTVLLDTGIVLLALSLVTVRHYVHLAPLWVVLTGAGLALVALALAVERALRRRPGGEVAGFTAAPLFSDERRQRLLQAVPVVAALTPAAPAAAREDEGFAGRGGAFGGGGASDRY
jgi:hypothetical protein